MTMSRCAVLGNFGVIIHHDNNIIVVWSSAEPYHGLFVSGNNNARSKNSSEWVGNTVVPDKVL